MIEIIFHEIKAVLRRREVRISIFIKLYPSVAVLCAVLNLGYHVTDLGIEVPSWMNCLLFLVILDIYHILHGDIGIHWLFGVVEVILREVSEDLEFVGFGLQSISLHPLGCLTDLFESVINHLNLLSDYLR